MKLYFSPGACSLSPHIVLHEAGLDFSIEQVDLKTKQTVTGADYRAVNQKGSVPALQLKDGTVLTEGPAIVQYIADQAPESQLAPAAGTLQRYQLMEWLNYISSEVHKSFSPLFNPAATEDMTSHARSTLAQRFSYLARALEGRDYLLGSQFSVADAYLFTVLSWAGYVKIDLGSPVLQSYLARVGARPAVQQALRAEGLVK
ncbi:MAG TPA: glutathione transferase GstA [Telluria sp.]